MEEKTHKRNYFLNSAVRLIFLGIIMGFVASVAALNYLPEKAQSFLTFLNPATSLTVQTTNPYISKNNYEQSIIDAAKKASPSVVSIVVSKNVPTYERHWVSPFGNLNPDFQIPKLVPKGSELQQVGAGTGFIVSQDGMALTNKHVVSDKQSEYTVFASDGQKYTAKVMALDPVQDLAVIKINASGKTFVPLVLGNSSEIQIGQTVIAIGNALGQFSNTVSVGVVSGLGRTVSASDEAGLFSETLEGIIQTDAAINSGNSGGPLLNLNGEVIGINTAMAQGAQSIGFAIPINMAKKDLDQVIKNNKIVYPFLGVRYVAVDSDVQEKYNLSVDYGAFLLKGDSGEPAVELGSAAQKAGLKENDIILQINGEKITKDNSMAKLIQKYNAGDKINIKILRDGKEQDMDVLLGERT